MIKSFSDMMAIEVPITKKPVFEWSKAKKEYEKKGDVDTLAWVDCLSLLYENGAEIVLFESVPNERGELLFVEGNGSASIKVFVDIDGDRREIFYPVIDGKKDIELDKIKQSDIYNAKQRAFVKCVAVNWGLGLKLWKKADLERVEKPTEVPFSKKFTRAINLAIKELGGVKQMLDFLGLSETKIKDLKEKAAQIDGIMAKLETLYDQE